MSLRWWSSPTSMPGGSGGQRGAGTSPPLRSAWISSASEAPCWSLFKEENPRVWGERGESHLGALGGGPLSVRSTLLCARSCPAFCDPVDLAALRAQLAKNPPAVQGTWLDSWVRKIPWRRDRLPTPVFLVFPGGSAACSVADLDPIPGLGRSPEKGKATHPSVLA